mgnify:CR=1 FL=1
MSKTKTLIMGAAGRDFHNFNTFYRDNEQYEVAAFTATQIPDIEGRIYPPELAGSLYPNGIPIYDESELILNDGGEIGIYEDISNGTYDLTDELWYWNGDNIKDVCHDCKEIRVKGEPSISRIDYIMFGIINKSKYRLSII